MLGFGQFVQNDGILQEFFPKFKSIKTALGLWRKITAKIWHQAVRLKKLLVKPQAEDEKKENKKGAPHARSGGILINNITSISEALYE